MVIAICLLAALVYETHNASGRYIQSSSKSNILIDTATGTMEGYKWGRKELLQLRPPIPNRSHSISSNSDDN